MSDNALLSYAEVLNWIAFGKAVEDDLVGSCHCDDCDPGILHALDVISGLVPPRQVDRPPELPEWLRGSKSPGELVDEQRAVHLLERTGMPSGDLADKMRPLVQEWRDRSQTWRNAITELTEAIFRKRLSICKASDTGLYAGRNSPGMLLGYQLPGLEEGWFRSEEVFRTWPVKTTTLAARKPVPKARLATFWASYVREHLSDQSAPSKKQAENAINAAFPDHRPVTARDYAILRKTDPTPKHWQEPGRRKSKRDAK